MVDPELFLIREQTSRQLRWGGALIVVLGAVVLVGGMLFATLLLGVTPPESWLPAGTHIEGTPGEGLTTFQRIALFSVTAALLAFGLAALTLGLWQVVTGRQPRLLLKFMLAILAAFWLVGGIASVISGCPVGRICQ